MCVPIKNIPASNPNSFFYPLRLPSPTLIPHVFPHKRTLFSCAKVLVFLRKFLWIPTDSYVFPHKQTLFNCSKVLVFLRKLLWIPMYSYVFPPQTNPGQLFERVGVPQEIPMDSYGFPCKWILYIYRYIHHKLCGNARQ